MILTSTTVTANHQTEPQTIAPQPAVKKTVPSSQLTSLLNFLFSPALTTKDTLVVSSPDTVGVRNGRRNDGEGSL